MCAANDIDQLIVPMVVMSNIMKYTVSNIKFGPKVIPKGTLCSTMMKLVERPVASMSG